MFLTVISCANNSLDEKYVLLNENKRMLNLSKLKFSVFEADTSLALFISN